MATHTLTVTIDPATLSAKLKDPDLEALGLASPAVAEILCTELSLHLVARVKLADRPNAPGKVVVLPFEFKGDELRVREPTSAPTLAEFTGGEVVASFGVVKIEYGPEGYSGELPEPMTDLEAAIDEDRDDDDDDCQGHPAGPFDPMGETVYCDGSCR